MIPTWIASQAGGRSPSPPAPEPGPLDFVINEGDLTEITLPFDLANPSAVVGLAFRYAGPTAPVFEATHGGEPLQVVRMDVREVSSYVGWEGTLLLLGNGLTLENADLVIRTTNGVEFGPCVGRVNDEFSEPMSVAWSGGGLNSVTLPPMLGDVHVKAAYANPFTVADLDVNPPNTSAFKAMASSGGVYNADFTAGLLLGTGAVAGAELTHTGTASGGMQWSINFQGSPNSSFMQFEIESSGGGSIIPSIIGGGTPAMSSYSLPMNGVYELGLRSANPLNTLRFLGTGEWELKSLTFRAGGMVVAGAFAFNANGKGGDLVSFSSPYTSVMSVMALVASSLWVLSNGEWNDGGLWIDGKVWED